MFRTLDIKKTIDADLSAKEVIEETTLYLWENQEEYFHLINASEIADQEDLFSIVGLSKLPFLANSDLHEKKHIYSWKTQAFAAKNRFPSKRPSRKKGGA